MLRPLLLLYNLLLPLLLLAALPRALRVNRSRGGYGGRFGQRLNRFDPATAARLRAQAEHQPLWLHAVSVGEVNVAAKWIRAARRLQPDLALVLSTTTTTGYAVALRQLDELARCEVIHSPIDLFPVVHGMLRRIRPRALVLVEAEVWPNWVWCAHRRQVPVLLINARLSPRSRRRYRKFRGLVRPLFSLLAQIQVQDPADAEFWIGLGLKKDRIHTVGSVKYDTAGASGDEPREREAIDQLDLLLRQHRRGSGGPVLLLASTHPGEELALLQALQPLRAEFPSLDLWIAPRHVERAGEVVGQLSAAGFRISRRSEWTADAPTASEPSDQADSVLLIDTTGELGHWQQLADMVIIGKSFLGRGGQNPAEAVAAGKPVMTGPHMDNFDALMDRLEQARGIVRVAGIAEVPGQVRAWLARPGEAAALGRRGREALAWHRGATDRSARLALESLDPDSSAPTVR